MLSTSSFNFTFDNEGRHVMTFPSKQTFLHKIKVKMESIYKVWPKTKSIMNIFPAIYAHIYTFEEKYLI